MSTRMLRLAWLCAVVACGDDNSSDPSDDVQPIDAPPATIDSPPPDMAIDAPPAVCPTGGAVTGTVAGEGFTQVTTTVGFDGPTLELIIVEEAATCDEPPASGEFLDMQICPGSGPGTYPIIEGPLDCSVPPGGASVFFGTLEVQTFATGGSVTITSAAGDCFSGTVTAQFPNADTMTGSFDLRLCR